MTFGLADRNNHPVSIEAEEVPVSGGAPGRLGVWLAFTTMAGKFSAHGFAAFGVSSAIIMRRAGGTPETELEGAEMCSLAAELAVALASLTGEGVLLRRHPPDAYFPAPQLLAAGG